MYINTLTLQYPISEAFIKAQFPNVSFGQPFVAPEPYAVVFPYPRPQFDWLSQTVVEDDPVLTGLGTWEQRWEVVDLAPEVAAANLAEAKAAVWESIKALRDKKTQGGGYFAAGKWFHSDTFSRTQQMGLVMLGESIPAGLQWKTMDGSYVTMTATVAAQVFAAAAQSDTVLFAHADALKAQVDAAQNPLAVDINAGWPAQYGD